MKVLVTGFEPFGGDTVNASWEAVRCLPDKIEGADILGLRVPVEYGVAGSHVLEAIRRSNPALVLCVGLASDRCEVTPELFAINWRMSAMADNEGTAYRGEKIREDGPAALMTDLPVLDMVDAIRSEGIPCRLSLSAGSFVCNDLYWSVLELAAGNGLPVLFVHVPSDYEIAPEDSAKALQIIIRMVLSR